MCGRYRLSRRAEILASYFYAEYEGMDWEARYNIAPTQAVPVIRQDPRDPVRRASLMRWGLVPNWAKDATIGARMINARSETAAEKPAFRELLQRRRCLIPANAFYEWSRHEVACVIVRRTPPDRTRHPIGSTLRGIAIRKRIV